MQRSTHDSQRFFQVIQAHSSQISNLAILKNLPAQFHANLTAFQGSLVAIQRIIDIIHKNRLVYIQGGYYSPMPQTKATLRKIAAIMRGILRSAAIPEVEIGNVAGAKEPGWDTQQIMQWLSTCCDTESANTTPNATIDTYQTILAPYLSVLASDSDNVLVSPAVRAAQPS